MSMKRILTSTACSAAFFAAFGAVAALSASAQQISDHPASSTKAVYLASATTAPTADTLSSSSSAGEAETAAAERLLSLDSATQPPPRPRYGRPTYHDSHTNADGSSKYAFDIGGGFTMPTGNTHKYLDTSYGFQAGGGRNFNKTLGLMVQFAWDNFGFQGSTLATQQSLYGISTLGGTSHVLSFSLAPIINFYTSDSLGAYVTGGVGFYHKTANFTVPTTGFACDYYGFCYQYAANQTIDKYSSNAPGANGGIGFTYKLSRFATERLFMEARYVFVDNSPRAASTTNFYPANSHRTEYVPVTLGIRW